MADQIEADEGVLPFDNSDVVNGVGEIKRIVDLGNYTDCAGVTADGRCNWCGYDRADYCSHTEVDDRNIVCRNCDGKVGE